MGKINLQSHNIHADNKLIMYAVKSFSHTKSNYNIDLGLIESVTTSVSALS